MKIIQLICLVILSSFIACVQNTNKNLDGNSYQISAWDINHPENKIRILLYLKQYDGF